MSTDEIKIGHLISAELLTALKQAFPLDRPRERDSERSIWIKSGNQEVIEFLTYQHGEAFHTANTPE